MSIKKAIIEKNDGNEVEKSEYVNLILDDMIIGEICEEDRTFLEGFTATQFLSLNSTGLKSIANLPKMENLERLELCDNKIASNEKTFAELPKLYPNLKVLKLSNNQIKSLDDLIPLKECTKLESIDLSNNPVS
jgi:acidic leucine-rich nuclear phosphoprotein 32 family member B